MSGDEKDELLAELERELRVAFEPGDVWLDTGELLRGRVVHARCPDALTRALQAIERAKVLKGVRW